MGRPARVREIELRRVTLPLLRPFEAAHASERERDLLLVRVRTDAGEGWGECGALAAPTYTSEYVDGAHAVMREHLAPRVIAAGTVGAEDVAAVLGPVKGHQMAKAALEMAVLDAELRTQNRSLGARLGATADRVPCGVAAGIAPSIPALLDEVDSYVAHGYRRVKLKIRPGWDLAPVAAVRERFGPDLILQADANGAYNERDAGRLRALDPYDLACLEQPLPQDELLAIAQVARQIQTPICLDESIVSVSTARDAIELGACRVICLKPSRVGGYLEALRIHDLCQEHGVGLWVGGMLESGLGRAGNLALAALPGCTLPGDLAGSDRYYARDLIRERLRVENGVIPVPSGPGLGVSVDLSYVEELSRSIELLAG